MQGYSQKQISELYHQFQNLKRYPDRITFFEEYFGIIPAGFPGFEPELKIFFDKDKTDALIEIYKGERNNRELNERIFSFGQTYKFSIRPANSNSALYSRYILARFLSLKPDFEDIVKERLAQYTLERLLDDANRIVNFIEYRLQYEYDKSMKLHCMTVFYRGFSDYFINAVRQPDKKRKFVELYLYAQGIMYAQYIETLKKYRLKKTVNVLPSLAPVFLFDRRNNIT